MKGRKARRKAGRCRYPADGLRPRTRTPGTPILSLCGRLQHLRQKRSGGTARDGGDHRLLGDEKLKLQVNRDKSAVARPWQRKFLGYSVTRHKQPRLKIADSSLKRLKDRVREIIVGNASRNLGKTVEALNPVLRGWTSYF